MSSSTLPPMTPAQLDALQSRFAKRVCARLGEASLQLPHDITERLRVARQQAVAAHATVGQHALVPEAKPASVAWASGQVATVGTGPHLPHAHARGPEEKPPSWGWRLACGLPALTLLLGLWGIQQWHQREQIQAAVDIDMALLTDKLPPAAYADPGFEEFLQTTSSSTDRSDAAPQAAVPLSL